MLLQERKQRLLLVWRQLSTTEYRSGQCCGYNSIKQIHRGGFDFLVTSKKLCPAEKDLTSYQWNKNKEEYLRAKARTSTRSQGLVLHWKCYIVPLEQRVNFFLINFPGSATRERLAFPLPLLKIYLSCWVLTARSCQPSVVAECFSKEGEKRKKGKKEEKKVKTDVIYSVSCGHISLQQIQRDALLFLSDQR